MTVHTVLTVLYLAVGLLVGLTVHEYAHAFSAYRLGDHAVKASGRMTLNPLPHLDPFGSLLLPGILLLPVLFGNLIFPIFAYAKPMPTGIWSPVKREHNTVVALAGPISNLVLALAAAGLFRATGRTGELGSLLSAFLLVNLTLAVMNIVPVPPLDGARIIVRFLPPRAREVYANLEQYGALFILLIFFVLGGVLVFPFVRVVADGICQLLVGGGCPPV